jgi:hypothetical protein
MGKGCELTVRLPLRQRRQGATEAEQMGAGAVPLTRQRIMIVDDNRDAADSLGLLLDLGMPGMDGYEVELTGWGQDADRQHTRACGFDLHLTKQVDFNVLKAWLTGG